MITNRTDHGANRHELVHHAGQARHQLANLNARHVGADRLKLAADFHRSVGLEVVHILMRRAAGQVDHNHGFVRTLSRDTLRPQQLRQRQTPKARPPIEKGRVANGGRKTCRTARRIESSAWQEFRNRGWGSRAGHSGGSQTKWGHCHTLRPKMKTRFGMARKQNGAGKTMGPEMHANARK